MKTSKAGLELLKQFEGCRLRAYQDPAGHWTIGWGHTSMAGPPKIRRGMTITQEKADDLLERDLFQYELAVQRATTRPLTQHQFDALVSLCYNIGPGNLAGSAVIALFNEGDLPGAARAFRHWNKARIKGHLQIVPGLIRRREAEKLLFERPYAPPTPLPADHPFLISDAAIPPPPDIEPAGEIHEMPTGFWSRLLNRMWG